MAGIYIHIPFCKQACHYCDFHFSTVMNNRAEVLNALKHELQLQKGYLSESVDTIYFGGGTPSLLNQGELQSLLDAVYENFEISKDVEITLEANPDDLTKDKLNTLKSSSVHRLSIGVQSFHDPHLKWMNRAHSSDEATNCIKDALDVGFEKLSLDLIYGIPFKDHSILNSDLVRLMELRPTHISAYALTIEPDTVFGRWEKVKKIKMPDEDFCAEQFQIVMQTMQENGYEHYEISNFLQR